jgi:hypothetical protein
MPGPDQIAAPPRPYANPNRFGATYHSNMQYPCGVWQQQVPLPGDMQRLHTLVPINMAHGRCPIDSTQVAHLSPQMVAVCHPLPGHPTYPVRLLLSHAISTVETAFVCIQFLDAAVFLLSWCVRWYTIC